MKSTCSADIRVALDSTVASNSIRVGSFRQALLAVKWQPAGEIGPDSVPGKLYAAAAARKWAGYAAAAAPAPVLPQLAAAPATSSSWQVLTSLSHAVMTDGPPGGAPQYDGKALMQRQHEPQDEGSLHV